MLDFSVPRTDSVLQGKVETRPRATADWLERLPFASPMDAAQQLAMALYSLNRRPLGGEARLALMALYRPVVSRAAASLETLLLEAGVPPHQQQRQTGVLLRELHSEHSIGYKQAVLALAGDRPSVPATPRVAETAALLIAALHDLQVACHLTYTVLPAGLWGEMHRIYQFARDNRLENHPGEGATVDATYRKALLLALADPPRMSAAEIMHTRQILDRFVGLATLGAPPAEIRAGFSVPTQGDAPPRNLTATVSSNGLWLDTDDLCRRLHDAAGRLRGGATPASVGLPREIDGVIAYNLCRRLVKQWGPGAQRAFKRHESPGSEVELVAGVSAIHRLLEQPAQAERTAADDGSVAIGDVGAPSPPPAVSASRWSVMNDSASGLALSGTPDTPLNLRVGDPLALRASAGEWSLGVIRWVRMRDARQVELGIERLSPNVQPVWVQPLRGKHQPAPEPALFLPGLAALKQGDRLLLPRNVYQAGMDAEVERGAHPFHLTFGRCMEHTHAFDLVDFTVFDHEQP